jgi:hypothetical protein
VNANGFLNQDVRYSTFLKYRKLHKHLGRFDTGHPTKLLRYSPGKVRKGAVTCRSLVPCLLLLCSKSCRSPQAIRSSENGNLRTFPSGNQYSHFRPQLALPIPLANDRKAPPDIRHNTKMATEAAVMRNATQGCITSLCFSSS